MNEKLNIQNLTDEFAESYGINRKDAEAFIKEFFSVIQEGLEKDKYVKIKGFGTFKLIEVDSRESINVNTGERFEIQGHSKITFTPDNNIKEAVNKPFSAFQTVVLADGVAIDAPEENLIDALSDEIKEEEPAVIEAEPQVEAASAEPKIEPVSKEDFASEEGTAEEESNAIEAPQAEAEPLDEPAASVEEPVAEEEPAVEEPVAEEPTPTEPSEEDEVQEAVIEEPVTETKTTQDDAEQPADATILSIFDDDAIKKKDQPVSHQEEVMALKLTEEKRKEISRKADRSATPYLMFLAVLTIMICLGIVAYIYYPDLAKNDAKPITPLSSEINTQQSEAESTIEAPVETTQPDVAPDSVAVPAVETQTQSEEPVKKEVTAPITVREESVPKAETQPATSVATQPTTSAAEQPKTTTKPAASAATQTAKPATQTAKPAAQTTKSATTLKVGKNEYVVEGEIETHVLSKGETLFSLSRKYYGNNAMYACIIEYNKDVIKNPDNIPEGTKLRIPKLVKK